MTQCKCRYCTEREVGCHSECIYYKDYREEIHRANKIKMEDKLFYAYKASNRHEYYRQYKVKKKMK